MYFKLNGKKYEVEDDKIEELLTENLILKTDELFNKLGSFEGMVKSLLNGWLVSQGYKKTKENTMLEIALMDMIDKIMTETKDQVFDFNLKEMIEEDEVKEVEDDDKTETGSI
jgi:hypothetical protein